MGETYWYFIIGSAVVIAFIDLVAVMNLWQSDKSPATKWLWTLIIICLPVIGLIIWGAVGPRGMPKPPTSPEQSK
ncbi:putative membrane protein [Pseudomonas sp. BIGb0408]|uniref:Putative membrane protein n=1 Tax=Phytopseudomonas flavescens TaxID=29435 RepID=A0A7Y9XMS4_9GAMM|nr:MULTISPECIES: PLD nuclease N-terminal domain-containing protein [Pseudomonas]MCW2292410.1 putative membrane protein [Pseudomonas sp. BIGb0408]NYH73019.1 putative membrane protein [Pseudomonas flavescens]